MEKHNTQRRMVELARTFDEVWENLSGKSIDLKTASGTSFVARAKTAKRRGSSVTEEVLVFLKNDGAGKLKECSRCYSEVWGYYFNHLGRQGQRVGMYLKTVDLMAL